MKPTRSMYSEWRSIKWKIIVATTTFKKCAIFGSIAGFTVALSF